ncbi:PQQ-dependent sugar dehydrogenase [Nonlabens mediterrranea]|uniref:PQQ-dependent sugar dehydrogenase n=1 Tax=Nonlabens mediterrranea TaxID=1419947 RepID=A0ABS0A4Y4_9FLAO|nr:PQQ-dependent sugar dehydrogenase [Nonlabens mediterrranea]
MKLYYSLIFSLLILSSCKESSKNNEMASTTTSNEVAENSDAPQVDHVPLIDDQKNYSIVPIVEDLDIPWGMTWLPNGDLLFTEKEGQLYRYNGTKSIEINGIPEVYLRGQGGLLDVTIHPQFEKNNFIYISYASKMGGGDGGNTTIARAVLKNNKLEDLEVLYKAMPNSKKGQHFGSRFTWDREGHLYFSIGDRGNRDVNPQDIYRDCGKIYRINDDGSIPVDNPFVDIAGAKTAIYSYGNRNPQGMTTHPVTGKIIAHEHGPQGGDEINIIESGKNYGWPVISYGINYSGTTFTEITEKEGMEQPIYYWVPSIAPSGFAIINNPAYQEWNGNFLVGALKFQYLEMLHMDGNRVTKREKIADKIGRLRNVKIGPDGLIYIAVEGKGIFKIEKK